MKNPALQQESRYEPATVIPLKQDLSLIDWLKANNRLIAREVIETTEAEYGEGEDITEFIDVDDNDYDDDDIDDGDDLEDVEE
jgi:Protein of unknown function (DUF3134)